MLSFLNVFRRPLFRGAVAHQGERFNGIEEVAGSSPASSTTTGASLNSPPFSFLAFNHACHLFPNRNDRARFRCSAGGMGISKAIEATLSTGCRPENSSRHHATGQGRCVAQHLQESPHNVFSSCRAGTRACGHSNPPRVIFPCARGPFLPGLRTRRKTATRLP